MTRDELLAALLAERQDCRWFPTPEKTPRDLGIRPDDDVTTALVDTAGHLWSVTWSAVA